MAPIPKPPGTRRRRNAAPAPTKLRADQTTREGVPPLPEASSFLPSTREWWKTIWSSPMATIWLDADVPALVRLAFLVDTASRGDARGYVLRAIQALEDRFGLSPLSRRRLQWEIDNAGGAASAENDPVNVINMARWSRIAQGED
jgi:hypothetical protein